MRFLIIFFWLFSFAAQAQFTITEDFFGAGEPAGLRASSGIEYIDIQTRFKWRQTTIPAGTHWSKISENNLVYFTFMSGNISVSQLNGGQNASSSTFWRGDGTWSAVPASGGTVTSVALTAPTEFSVTGSPVTTTGILGLGWVNQSPYTLFARGTGTGVPSFQAGDTTFISDFYVKVRSLLYYPWVEETGDFTLALSDALTFTHVNSASLVDVTVPPNSSVAFSLGTRILFTQEGAGDVVFAAGSGVTVNSYMGYTKILGQYGVATLVKTGTDEWWLYGDLATDIDPDAQDYFTAANITDADTMSAVNTMVVALKAASLWSRFIAIYPCVSASVGAMQFNLVDPQDLDASYRLTFTGGWTYNANGMTPNGSTGYADTHMDPTNDFSAYSYSGFVYLGTLDLSGNKTAFGTIGTAAGSYFQINVPNATYTAIAGQLATNIGVTLSDSRGFLAACRTAAAQFDLYQGSTNKGSNTTSLTANSANDIYIGANDNNGSPINYSSYSFRFVAFADGFSSTDESTLYTIVEAFETTLGRSAP